jgi:hypothetical protein
MRLNISVNFAALREAKWYQFALRFFFGGTICVLAGVIAENYGPRVGGLFLAFPAIFPASATLMENEEKEKKQRAGLHGAIRGRKVAGVDAVGAAIGSLGMIAFAAIVRQLLPGRSPSLILLDATLAWFVVSVTIWRLRSLFVHWRRHKPMSHHGDLAR